MNNVEKTDTVEFIIFTDLFTLAVLHLECEMRDSTMYLHWRLSVSR